MAYEHMPFRTRVANRVFDALRAAAKKIGIDENASDRFVLRSLLFGTSKAEVARHKSKTREKGKVIHVTGARRDARRRAKAARAEQRAKRLYRRAQA